MRLHTDGHCAITRHESLDLHMTETGASGIADENVRVGTIAKRDHRHKLATAQLSRNEELRGIATVAFIVTSIHAQTAYPNRSFDRRTASALKTFGCRNTTASNALSLI